MIYPLTFYSTCAIRKSMPIKIYHLKDMVGGWFIGNFTPSVYRTTHFEVAYKKHCKGDMWPRHAQKRAIEINLMVKGKLLIGNMEYMCGDIFIVPPRIFLKPRFLTDCEVVCIKVPSLPKDKVILR